MLKDLFVDKDYVDVLEWLILHEKWEQYIPNIAGYLKISKRKIKKIMKKLYLFKIIRYSNENHVTVLNNQLVTACRVLMNEVSTQYINILIG